jgi:hypothetical protein
MKPLTFIAALHDDYLAVYHHLVAFYHHNDYFFFPLLSTFNFAKHTGSTQVSSLAHVFSSTSHITYQRDSDHLSKRRKNVKR